MMVQIADGSVDKQENEEFLHVNYSDKNFCKSLESFLYTDKSQIDC